MPAAGQLAPEAVSAAGLAGADANCAPDFWTKMGSGAAGLEDWWLGASNAGGAVMLSGCDEKAQVDRYA